MTGRLIPCFLICIFYFCSCDSPEDDTQIAKNTDSLEMTPTPVEISVEELKDYLSAGDSLLLLDVRTLEEYSESRLANTDIRIPYDSLEEALGRLPAERNLFICCYCRSGRRSLIATYLLREHGFTNARNLSGGIIAWREAGFPTVSGP